MVLFPGFQALDVFGPLDMLNMLAFNNTITLSIVAPTLEPVSSGLVAMNLANSTMHESIVPTHTFKEPPTDLEVLFVPGGAGTRNPNITEAIDYVKATYPSLKYIVSVCTGATILARAGVLDGKRATTNKRAWAWATSTGPNVSWVPVARWVQDGNVWTSSGVAAGIDATLAFVTYLYGEEVAVNLANGAEYERHTNASWDPFSSIWNVPGAPPL